jgi:integrase
VPLSEEDRLLTMCDDDSNLLLGKIVRFAILTAMRQGEIVGLLWQDTARVPDSRSRTAAVARRCSLGPRWPTDCGALRGPHRQPARPVPREA